ncbi:MAG TPA: hypothetical protein VEQ85_06730 [Lacipirellulaceae bacterium]|nr:hypothetical protein [Lacipirellulaceae bacterium]
MNVARCLWTAGLLIAMGPALAMGQSTGVPAVGTTTSSEDASQPASPWGWLQMPKFTMPKVTMPKLPADPLAPVKASARKVSEGTKRAWEGTKELFTFGGGKKDEPVARVASREEPSMLQKMFGAEPEQPPQTVADFMAQPRVE